MSAPTSSSCHTRADAAPPPGAAAPRPRLQRHQRASERGRAPGEPGAPGGAHPLSRRATGSPAAAPARRATTRPPATSRSTSPRSAWTPPGPRGTSSRSPPPRPRGRGEQPRPRREVGAPRAHALPGLRARTQLRHSPGRGDRAARVRRLRGDRAGARIRRLPWSGPQGEDRRPAHRRTFVLSPSRARALRHHPDEAGERGWPRRRRHADRSNPGPDLPLGSAGEAVPRRRHALARSGRRARRRVAGHAGRGEALGQRGGISLRRGAAVAERGSDRR